MKNRLLWLSIGISQILFLVLLPVWLRLLAYLHPVVLVVVWSCVTLLVFFLVYLIGKGTIVVPNLLIKSVMCMYSLGLFILLFFRPSNQEYNQVNLMPFRTILGFFSGDANFLVAFYNITANILLFVPYGVAAYLLNKRPSQVKLIFFPILSILLIEAAQYFTKRGSMDIDDFILNVLGVGMGYLLHPIIQKVVVVK
ncbi:VanZ family protein [Neobacillus sp. NRS-1170]|uniref:VanZ family protein n=1 Tax=Neobacillus sp. NRS-1170 TaxID=3233898 RepID=UPI003D2D32B9